MGLYCGVYGRDNIDFFANYMGVSRRSYLEALQSMSLVWPGDFDELDLNELCGISMRLGVNPVSGMVFGISHGGGVKLVVSLDAMQEIVSIHGGAVSFERPVFDWVKGVNDNEYWVSADVKIGGCEFNCGGRFSRNVREYAE